jgi:hypothetical protein
MYAQYLFDRMFGGGEEEDGEGDGQLKFTVYGEKFQTGKVFRVKGSTNLGDFRKKIAEAAGLDVSPFLLNYRGGDDYSTWIKDNMPKVDDNLGDVQRTDESEKASLTSIISDTPVSSLAVKQGGGVSGRRVKGRKVGGGRVGGSRVRGGAKDRGGDDTAGKKHNLVYVLSLTT